MDKDFRTSGSILEAMERWVRERQVVDAHTWVDACQALNALQGEETDRLFDLQQIVARLKVGYIEAGDTVAKATVKVQASDEWKDMLKQNARVSRIIEAIRISKIQARLKDSEYRSQ